MITDEMLRRAAVISSDAFVRGIEERYGNEHVFSPGFEKKIRKLYLRANHPYLYRLMRQVASILLALLIGGGVWLTVDKEARAAFFGWVKEVYETAVWYCSGGNTDKSAERKEYHLPVIPEGYEEIFTKNNSGGRIKVYANEHQQQLQFHYRFGTDITGLGAYGGSVNIFDITVNGQKADVMTFDDPHIANVIMWRTKENIAFEISGFLSLEELVTLAESVEEVP